ncbi:MAG: CDP-alcohol phosphatidyltransferase family protein [Candidatus Aenigmarchaeota archaeon]|nr:CDP-alcohol phosphatidyltransferase family protein [Candidatus Aenigmarchaeota archaeon]
MLYAKREKLEKLSIKIGIRFSKLGISPNTWTLFAIIPAILSAYFMLTENFLAAALFLLIAAFMDVIDGAVARVTGRVTKLGAYIDCLTDRYVEFIVILSLMFISLPFFIVQPYIWIALVIFGAMMTTYAKATAKEKELVDKEIRGGILERAERVFLLLIGIALAYFNPLYLVYVLALLAILTNLTALQRIYIAVKSSKEQL